METETKTAFDLGSVYMTPAAIEVIRESNQLPTLFLIKHVNLERGELSEEDFQENFLSMKEGYRIFSSFKAANGEKIWVITEADRSSTTILTPSEY